MSVTLSHRVNLSDISFLLPVRIDSTIINLKNRLYFYCFLMVLYGCMDSKQSYNPVQEDIHYFFESIRELHPDPYMYINKKTFDSLENILLNEAKNIHRLKDLNVRLMSCNQYFDGHTACFIHPDFVNLGYLLPIKVLSDTIIWNPTGERVFAIDTIRAEDYLKRVYCFIPHDLSDKTKSEWYANSFFFLLLNDFKPPRYVEVYNKNTGQIVRKKYEGYVKNNDSGSPKEYDAFYLDSIAILQYNTCFIHDQDAWQKNISRFFYTISQRKVNHLFIDVRNNGGGDGLNNLDIYEHLKFGHDTLTETIKITRKGGLAFAKFVLPQVSSLKMKMILRFEMLKIFLFGGVDKEITQSFLNSSGYDGNIYILQGHHTYSAASDLCYLLKALYPNAILVGDKNGQSIPMVGQRLTRKLPNSKIPFYIGTKKSEYKNHFNLENGFLLPDIPFRFSRTDTLYYDELVEILELNNLFE